MPDRSRAPKRSIMAVFPREIVRGRAWLREVEANLPTLAAKPALIVWPDSDPGSATPSWRAGRRDSRRRRTVILTRTGQFIDEDAPDDVAAAILAWWDERGSRSGVGRRACAAPGPTYRASMMPVISDQVAAVADHERSCRG